MRTVPVTRAVGLVSCMRFRQRTKVLFPQPDGPMRAVAWLAGMFRVMSWSEWFVPYHAFRLLTSIATPTTAFLLLLRAELQALGRRPLTESPESRALSNSTLTTGDPSSLPLSRRRGW